jgi:excisionase family DNA binding protein
MAHPTYLRDKARSLRAERKLTIDELAERLALSRSTIYYWVRDMPIPGSGSGSGWPESAHRKAARAITRKHRLLREAAYTEGLESFERLSLEASFRDFLCLYIAEGSKRNRNAVAVANSDPAVMQLATHWMRELAQRPLTFWIQMHADQDPEELREFWSGALKTTPDAIGLQRKSNSSRLKGRQWRSRHGVLTVRSNDTYFRARLQAWMDCIRADWVQKSV